MIANDRTEVAFHGEYREIVPTDRIVSTESSRASRRGCTRRSTRP